MSWTEEKVAELAKLWQEGLTTGEIGKRLGVSKNAVVGKAHRLGLQGRPSPIKRDAEATPKKEKEKKKNRNVTLMDLNSRTCRWPIGDPRDENFHFCGKEIQVGETYCKQHAEIAFVAPGKLGKNNDNEDSFEEE